MRTSSRKVEWVLFFLAKRLIPFCTGFEYKKPPTFMAVLGVSDLLLQRYFMDYFWVFGLLCWSGRFNFQLVCVLSRCNV